MLIDVTSNHIKLGKRESCIKCPIALAIQQKLGKLLTRCLADEIAVFPKCGVTPAYVKIFGERYYILSEEVNKFIMDFDNEREVEPFQFDLDVYVRSKGILGENSIYFE